MLKYDFFRLVISWTILDFFCIFLKTEYTELKSYENFAVRRADNFFCEVIS